MSVTACFKYNTDTSRVRLLLSIKSRVMLGCGICSSLKALIIPSGQVVQHLHRNEIPLSFLAQAKHICRTTFQCATSTKDAVVSSSCAMEFTGSDAIVTTSELSFTPGQWIVPVIITAGLENLSNLAATPSASTSKNPPTGLSQTSNPTTPGSASSSPSSTASSGLSTGAKAGIGVSVAIVFFLYYAFCSSSSSSAGAK